MTRKSKQVFVDEAVGLLVKQFGVLPVRAALARASNGANSASANQPRGSSRKANLRTSPSVTSTLEQLRLTDAEKYRVLADFYARLKDRAVLPESQDIRHFAQIIGLKETSGNSRKDMIPSLMRFLMERPIVRLHSDIEKAASVSEQQRQKGFSVLTDKLLGEKPESKPEKG
jgi:hypothetical protein